MKKILVIMGGPSSEHEVSLHTGTMIGKNINKTYGVETIKIAKNNYWEIDSKLFNLNDAIKIIKQKKFDLIFIALHGAFGEDGHLQGLLEKENIKFTGSSSKSAALAMDKFSARSIYEKSGFYTPATQRLISKDEKIEVPLPFVVKPNKGGSSIGVSIVTKKEMVSQALGKAFSENPEVLVQEYIDGQEFTCAVLETEDETKALSPIMINPKHASFFDYDSKYIAGEADEIVNPPIPKEKLEEIKELALRAHQVLGCRGFSRSDFIEKNGQFYIIETNIIPGMTENSLLPKSAKGSGIDFPELINTMVTVGLKGK